MNREDWGRIGTLFDEALEHEGAERDEFLSGLDDEALAGELRSLLAAHEGRGAFDELTERLSGPGRTSLSVTLPTGSSRP
jgi:hypothetical protein